MKLFIHNQFQDVIEIEIDGTAKVLDLKKMISSQVKCVMVSDQELKLCTKTLNDSDTIHASGIRPNSVIQLIMKETYHIFIKTQDNRIHVLNVHYTNTVEYIKKKLNRLFDIAVENLHLFFNGKELQNADILTEKNIKAGATLTAMVTNIKVQLKIVRQSGQVDHIEIPKNTTIGELKQMTLAKYDVPPGYQILKFKEMMLDNNDKTLSDYNIENDAEINFQINDIEIYIDSVTIGRKSITLRVFPIDTIGLVKDKIEAVSKVPKTVQQIIWNGRVLGDSVILSDEKIFTRSTLILVVTVQTIKLNIKVGPEDKIRIEAQSTDTVAQLKQKLLHNTKLPIDEQILFVDNTKLDDSKLLLDYGLNETSDIAMERKDSFDILIESLTDRRITLRVQKKDNVASVKGQIDRRLGIEPEFQRLMYCGHILKNNNTLEHYRIDKQCTLHLMTRLPGGSICVI